MASTLSDDPARSMRVLWNLLGLDTFSGVELFSMNELAGVDVWTKIKVKLRNVTLVIRLFGVITV